MNTSILQELMSFLPISVYIKDCEGKFLMVSKQKALNAGTTPEEMIGKTDFDFMLPEEASRAWSEDQQVLQTGKPICGRIEKRLRKDGIETFSLTTRAPRFDEHERLIGIMGISQDITTMMEYEDAMRNLFLNESHNIKNPLIASNGQIRRMIQGKYGALNEKALGMLKHIHIELSAVELQVKSSLMEIALLGFEDDTDIKGSHMASRINLQDDIVEPILYAYSNQISEKAIAIQNTISEAIILRVQRAWLSSVFDVVLSNSLKYGDYGCSITISAQLEDSRIIIAISNTGEPLEEEFVRERLFRKFQRQNDNVEGSGIGLYTSRKIMRMMHGDIAYRETPDGHPEFYFWIPL